MKANGKEISAFGLLQSLRQYFPYQHHKLSVFHVLLVLINYMCIYIYICLQVLNFLSQKNDIIFKF